MLRKPHKLRVVLLSAGFCALTGMVLGRLYYLQVANHESYESRARDQHRERVVVMAERGEIQDRKGRPLAASKGTLTVSIRPAYFHPPHADVDLRQLAQKVAHYSPLSANALYDRMTGKPDVTTNIGRQMEPENANKIMSILSEAGIAGEGRWFDRESKRLYPRRLAPQVIGYCTRDAQGDNIGLSGLEYEFNSTLQGEQTIGWTNRTARRQLMEPVRHEDLVNARGDTLVLTIDSAIQEAAEESLAWAAEEFNPDAAGAIVQDAETGAILAMASWPTFDNAEFHEYPQETHRNRILTDPLETGSVVKLFTAGMLLDSGKVAIDTLVDCEMGRARIGPRNVRDTAGHEMGVVPFYEVIRHSSNVGTVKAAQLMENDEWYDYLRAFGLGERTGIDLPGEGAGILRPPHRWDDYSRVSLAMGYEMALTPLQIANGITALVNGGELLRPYIVKEVRDARGNVVERNGRTVMGRAIRPSTSMLMRQIMEDVVVNGTGEKARVPGFRVGGKTGTTRKSDVFTHREYIASFAGVLPIDSPKVTIYCYVDNPKGDHYYASKVAAPVFQQIAQAAVLYLGLVPNVPVAGDEPLIADSVL